jgi:hypothetical protein
MTDSLVTADSPQIGSLVTELELEKREVVDQKASDRDLPLRCLPPQRDFIACHCFQHERV